MGYFPLTPGTPTIGEFFVLPIREDGQMKKINVTDTFEGQSAEAWFCPKFVFVDTTRMGAPPPRCPVHGVEMKEPKSDPWFLNRPRVLLDRY